MPLIRELYVDVPLVTPERREPTYPNRYIPAQMKAAQF
jgi:hypothetical protein